MSGAGRTARMHGGWASNTSKHMAMLRLRCCYVVDLVSFPQLARIGDCRNVPRQLLLKPRPQKLRNPV